MDISIVPMTVPAITKAGTLYTSSEKSKPVSFLRTTGNASVFLTSTAGQITVSQQVSLDGEKWYDPVNSAGAAIGQVVSGQTVTTGRWIAFNPVMAPYIRFKIVEANVAATTVALKLLFEE